MRTKFAIIVTISLFIVLGCSKGKSTTINGPQLGPANHQVRYELTGTRGRSMTVSWIGTDGRTNKGDFAIPRTFNAIRSDSDYVSISAKLTNVGGAFVVVTCEIFVDGKLWRSDTDAGNLINVNAHGYIGVAE